VNLKDLDTAIRKVPDFPKPGILFYDITGILIKPEAFRFCIDSMLDLYKPGEIDGVAAIEARGFLFAAPFAERAGLPLILVRKRGKLPGPKASRRFMLEYGEDIIEIHKSDVEGGKRILIVDDLAATGGTLKAAAEMITETGGIVKDIFCVVGLPDLNYLSVLEDYRVKTLITYQGG
jgi:adenine phosphoribosyltransferase